MQATSARMTVCDFIVGGRYRSENEAMNELKRSRARRLQSAAYGSVSEAISVLSAFSSIDARFGARARRTRRRANYCAIRADGVFGTASARFIRALQEQSDLNARDTAGDSVRSLIVRRSYGSENGERSEAAANTPTR